MTDSAYTELLKAWGIGFAERKQDLAIAGSPERTAMRTVVRDEKGKFWILEQIEPDNLDRKQQVAENITCLSKHIHSVHPWCRSVEKQFFQTFGNHNWMVRPYVEGMPLDRETWLNEPWRLEAMAEFLIRLQKCSGLQSASFFSMPDYTAKRMKAWGSRYPKLAEALSPVFGRLRNGFFSVHDSLPTAFCHGDFHPLNIVWGEGHIRSVIDWEFCGIKPELYDVALLLGCIGFDDPDNLIREPAVRLVGRLKESGFGDHQSWNELTGLMATIRFGWMSEWIRRQDEESVEMEVVYIDILVDQASFLSKTWGLG
ncbi:aminoglycoside phosphotransferase family protein [Tichowtungia aerotolerans]|uniref:Phosphotransferase n=1 Tax=Tichowtungia aerotolerans TaxID=2697043 RepID=A0A6P1MBP3_9BACT|nr:aminoglycoside phosphotransferase family protein [Tichowtungia aerotolerans]QHI70523.1 phosphotransferase [Tichowtungia aerotolerans]